ncbi:unnamed protein product [Victoria cruziana]
MENRGNRHSIWSFTGQMGADI